MTWWAAVPSHPLLFLHYDFSTILYLLVAFVGILKLLTSGRMGMKVSLGHT